LFTTDTIAVVPGETWNCPSGIGTVNVIAVSLQLFTWKAAEFPGAPHDVPPSMKWT
jgi:hypothetical protein